VSRAQFVAKAIRTAERALGVPAGWWGAYVDVRGPGGRRVQFGQMHGSRCWVVSVNGKRISGHDSRIGAIAKAVRS